MTKLTTGFVLLLSLVIVFSCKKKDETSVLGLDVQPSNDFLRVTISDTSSVKMYTQLIDPVRTYNDQYKFLGSNQDPIFGRTDASIYTNVSIPNNLTNLSFGTNPVLDSAELVILFTGEITGDPATTLNYQVYTLNQKLITDSAYRSNSVIAMSAQPINTVDGKLRTRNGETYLVLKLNQNLAQYILQTNSNLVNNTAFQTAYKGFYITTANSSLGIPGSGAIRGFNLDDSYSGLVLYYHDGNSVDSKSQKFTFSFSGTDALRYNSFKHNYISGATTNLYNQIINGNKFAGNSNIYLNTFGGTRVKVELPYLSNFADSQKVAISRAELIVKIDETVSPYNPMYSYPASLALIACGADSTEELVYDQLESSDFVKYSGAHDATSKQYVFNIARQMQKILNKEISNYGFYLVNALPSPSSVIRRDNRYQRLIFGGKTNFNYKPVFKVTYVKFPYDK